MKNKQYSVKTIDDISKIITTENYKVLLSDLAETFLRVVQIKQAIKDKEGNYPSVSIMDEILWTDDDNQGLSSLTINGEKIDLVPMKDQIKDLDND